MPVVLNVFGSTFLRTIHTIGIRGATLLVCVVVCLKVVVPSVQAAEHPSLLVTSTEREDLIQKAQRTPIVQDALNRMADQRWYAGAPADVQAEGWSRQLVELSFTGFLLNRSDLQAQAKSILLAKSQGPEKYAFTNVFFQDERKYIYGQACTALALGYDMLAPQLSATERQVVTEQLNEWGQGLHSFYLQSGNNSKANFHTSSIACLGILGLVLQNENPEASAWYTFAKNNFRSSYMAEAFNPGGDYYEGHVYFQYGASPALLFAAAAQKTAQEDLTQNSGIRQLWNYYLTLYTSAGVLARIGDNSNSLMMTGPDWYILRFSDQNSVLSSALWLWQQLRGQTAAQIGNSRFNFKDFDHLGIVLYYPDLAQVSPQQPTESSLPRSRVLPSLTQGTTQGFTDYPGGMAVLGTGWEPTQSMSLLLLNRWRWQNHQHYDPNAFQLSAYGQTLVSNENNRSYDDPLRGKWSQQNTILIDRGTFNGDAPRGPFTTGSSSSLGTFPLFFQSAAADIVVSDSRYAHANFGLFQLPNSSYSNANTDIVQPIDQANRSIFFLKQFSSQPFYVMLDQFMKIGSHTYTWQAFIPNRATQASGSGHPENPYQFFVDGVSLRLLFLQPSEFSLTLEPPQSGRTDRPVTVQSADQTQGTFLTVMVPDNSGIANLVTATILQASNPQVSQVRIDSDTILILYNPDKQTYRFQDWESDAELALVKTPISSSTMAVLYNATFARVGTSSVFSSAQRTTTVVGSSQTCTNSPDINHDGLVNLSDFSLIVGQLLQSGNQLTGDLNCDEQINLVDLTILLNQLRI